MKITIQSNPQITIEVEENKTSEKFPLTGIYVPPIAPARDSEPKPDPKPKLGGTRGRKGKGPACSNCGQSGHNKITCPKNKKAAAESDPFDDDLAEKIQTMRDEGFSSQYVADDLRIPLETVNRYW